MADKTPAADKKPDSLKKISGLAKVLTITLFVGVALDAVSTMASLVSYSMGPLPADSNKWTDAQLAITGCEFLLGVGQLLLIFTNAIIFLQWMLRCYMNLEFVNTPRLKHKSFWAVAYWFVPFANLIKPYHLMKEIYYGSDPGLTTAEPGDFLKLRAPAYFVFWWLCWICQGFLGQASFRMTMQGTKDPAFEAANSGTIDLMNSACDIFSVIAALLLIKIIKEITTRQETKIPELKTL